MTKQFHKAIMRRSRSETIFNKTRNTKILKNSKTSLWTISVKNFKKKMYFAKHLC